MKIKLLTSAYVECDVSQGMSWYRGRDVESQAKQMESLVSEFNDFVRDHRSMDWVNLSVIREFSDVCSFCKCEWEIDDDGVPMCCQKAIQEHNENLQKAEG